MLYLTGYSDRLFKEKTGLWADEAFLEKPFTSKGLREALALLVFGTLKTGVVTGDETEPEPAPIAPVPKP